MIGLGPIILNQRNSLIVHIKYNIQTLSTEIVWLYTTLIGIMYVKLQINNIMMIITTINYIK